MRAMSKNGNPGIGTSACPIRVAIYARKSNEQERGVTGSTESVERQVNDGRAHSVKIGLGEVAPELIFVDDALSGSLPEAQRPGFGALLAAVKRGDVTHLIVAAPDRLARDQFISADTLGTLSKAGVRLFFYLQNREADLSTPTGRFMEFVPAYAAEQYRVSGIEHTVSALKEKARAGFATGGVVFGYANTRVGGRIDAPAGERPGGNVERRINPEQAAVVRRIFTEFAAGHSRKRIAAELNADGAPSPAKSGGWRPGGWTRAAVRDTLYRQLYRGLMITRWGDGEEISVQNESVRIIPEPLWAETRRLLDDSRRIYLRKTNGQLFGRPSNGIESRYLLTGMMTCAACGSTMTVRSRPSGRRRVFVYMCESNIHGRRRQRQPEQCKNNLPLPMTLADQAMLDTVERTVLDEHVVNETIRESLARLDPQRQAGKREALETERKRLERELANLTTAIAAGDPPPTLVAEIKKRDARVHEIADDLDRLSKADALVRIDLSKIETELRERLNDWRGLLGRHVQSGRQILRKLIPSRLVLTPHVTETEAWYSYEGAGRLEPLLAGVLPVANLQRSNPVGATTVILWWFSPRSLVPLGGGI